MSIRSSLARAFGRGDPIEQKSFALTDPAALALFGVQPVASGMTITAASAMRVPAVRRAVSLIAESVACLPFKVYEHDSREAAKDHPAFALVHDHANDWTSAEAFRENLTADALLTGHGYAQVARNVEGKPVFMLRMDPSAVTVEHDEYGEPSYRIRLKDGGDQVLSFSDVLHIQPLHGVSPITLAREAIGLALAAEQHLAGFYRNGGRPSGVIRHPNKLDAEGAKKLAASWFTTHSGDQAGKTAVLDEGMEFQEIALKLADAEFSEVRREQVREIARAFGVPPASLFEMSRATWSNYEQAQREFLTGTLRPWIARWQAAYSRCLLTPQERASVYIEGNPDDMLSVDHAARAQAFPKNGSTLTALASDGGAAHGLTPSFTLIDEVHAWRGRDLWEAIKSGQAKTDDTLMVIATTAGRGAEGLAADLFSYARRVATGEIDNPEFLPVLFMAEPDDDWQDQATWFKANPGLAFGFPSMSGLRALAKEAEGNPAELASFKQFNLNIWQANSRDPLFDLLTYDSRQLDDDEADLEALPAYVGVDMSVSGDLTAVSIAFRHDDGQITLRSRVFAPGDELRLRGDRDGAPYERWRDDDLITVCPGPIIDNDMVANHVRDL